MDPKYPIYIISKGRADSRLTVKSLELMNCPYRVVIEPQEYNDYAAVIDPENILVLPFSNLGQGSIPARNWVWEHSISEGHERHWILDDNIRWFYRLHQNTKIRIDTPTCFRVCEDYSDRFTDVKMSGLNYHFFCPTGTKRPPFYHNTRVYSCILLSNDLYPDFAWRGRFNEDTDLSIRVMKAGYHTILLNSFLAGKQGTHTMKGGNTEEVYKVGDDSSFDNRMEFAESLRLQHPDVVRVGLRWGRNHHYVDYKQFQGPDNQPTLKPGLNIPKGRDNYGLRLVKKRNPKDAQG